MNCCECNRSIVKAHRSLSGSPVCGSCYPRVFPRRPCAICGKAARTHRNEERAICKSCEIADRVCGRCHKPVPRAGKRIGEQVVCPSCAPYFREARPCDACGLLSTRLSRVAGFNERGRLCEKCQRNCNQATCSLCRKHRKAYVCLLSKKVMCEPCFKSSSGRLCPDCGAEIGGSGNSPCLPCGAERAGEKKLEWLRENLTNPSNRALLQEFELWVERNNKLRKISIAFRACADFFLRCDVEWPLGVDKLGNEVLGAMFSAEEMRRMGQISLFLSDFGYLTADAHGREMWSVNKLIAKKFDEIVGQPWESDVRQFLTSLAEPRDKPLSPRSIKSYVSAAIGILSHSGIGQNEKLTGKTISSYLRTSPGQRASLSAFVSFYNERHKSNLQLPRKPKSKASFRKTVDELADLTVAIEKSSGIKQRLRIAKAFSILFGVPFSTTLKLSRPDIILDGQTGKVRIAEDWIPLPAQTIPWANALLANAGSAETELRLFPGRSVQDSLSISGANYLLEG